MRKFILVLRGPSGSGKTSLARKIQENIGSKVAHLKADYYYWKVCPQDENKNIDNNPIVYENLIDLAENYLANDYSVIIEGLLNQIDNFGMQEKLISLAERFDAKLERYYLDIDLEIARQRHAADNFSVPIEECEGWRKNRPMNKSELDKTIDTTDQTTDQIADQILAVL